MNKAELAQKYHAIGSRLMGSYIKSSPQLGQSLGADYIYVSNLILETEDENITCLVSELRCNLNRSYYYYFGDVKRNATLQVMADTLERATS